MTLGLIIIFVAGILQGTWALGVKRSEPLSWEAFWMPFSLIGMIIIPLLWVSTVIPDLRGILSEVPSRVIWLPFIFGALWGIGAVTFGLAIRYIGLSLSFGVNMGLASAIGALIPFFQLDQLSRPLILTVLGGVCIMLAGVILITRAGLLREKLQGKGKDQIVKKGATRTGIILAMVGGLSTAAFNIGFNYGLPLAQVAQDKGATAANGSLVIWLFVLSGGFIMNFGYSLFLLIRKRTFRDYRLPGSGRGMLIMVITALFWFAAIGLYGQGAAVMGEMGPVAGWIMFMALSLIVSNIWGLITGEWKKMKLALKYLFWGNILLIISWIILGLANSI